MVNNDFLPDVNVVHLSYNKFQRLYIRCSLYIYIHLLIRMITLLLNTG